MANTVKSAPKTFNESELPSFVKVINGFHGKLVYECKRTGEVYVWEEFGDAQIMELQELKIAKSAHKDFFSNGWFLFEDDWIYDFLGVRELYSVINMGDFDGMFKGTPSQVKSRIAKLNSGQKQSALFRLRELIADNGIDSLKMIEALEEAFGVDLMER